MRGVNTQIEAHITGRISDSQVLQLLKKGKVDYRYIGYLKEQCDISDELFASWLDINVKTFRNYKNNQQQLKESQQEHLILLVSLFRHGKEVFGNVELFAEWLEKPNFYLDGDKPIKHLVSITGIRFIKDRLTAIEYGDNA